MSDEQWLADLRQRDYSWATDDQWECVRMVARWFKGFHHLPRSPKAFGSGVVLNFHPHWVSTYDFDYLTRLVFLAHDECIRVEIEGSGPGMIKLLLHKRHKREGQMHERHPTLEEAVTSWRKLQ